VRVLTHIKKLDDDIPVVVRMRVECARCGHAEDDTYEFDLPLAKAQPREEYVSGKCPECGAPIQMHLRRTQQVQ
jgi:ribosomal protein S27AE